MAANVECNKVNLQKKKYILYIFEVLEESEKKQNVENLKGSENLPDAL